jgi:predicted nucleic acid-binding protein
VKYVDTDVFVYWATDHPDHGRRATEILRHIELNEKAVTSVLTLLWFHRVMRETSGYSFQAFFDQVTRLRNLKIVDLDAAMLSEAMEAKRRFNVDESTAIPYAVAKERDVDAVYSTNADFEKTDLKRVF